MTQYRYAYRQTLLEIPAGKLERGEDPYAAALRELREETGASTEELTSLGEVYPSPGYCNEIIRLYLARNLTWGEMDPDDDEFLDVERVPFHTLVEQVLSGEITDAKTCVAVLKAKRCWGCEGRHALQEGLWNRKRRSSLWRTRRILWISSASTSSGRGMRPWRPTTGRRAWSWPGSRTRTSSCWM